MSHLGYLRDRARRANRPAARVFEARYPGRCGICDEAIHAGQDATYIDDEIAHASCPDPTPSAPAVACGQCYMIPAVSGMCGCEDD